MYVSLGSDFAVRDRTIVGIFDLDNTFSSKKTRKLLAKAEQNGEIIDILGTLPKNYFTDAELRGELFDIAGSLPKSYVITREFGFQRVYLTQYNASALEKRL